MALHVGDCASMYTVEVREGLLEVIDSHEFVLDGRWVVHAFECASPALNRPAKPSYIGVTGIVDSLVGADSVKYQNPDLHGRDEGGTLEDPTLAVEPGSASGSAPTAYGAAPIPGTQWFTITFAVPESVGNNCGSRLGTETDGALEHGG